jgi:hypothetical protein
MVQSRTRFIGMDVHKESIMPVLFHIHHLFNAAQCQASIRMLRWQDRPLQCPRCQSHHIGPWGTYSYRPPGVPTVLVPWLSAHLQ